MKKKSYKWLARLIDKITKTDCPNNNYFWYYGREINLQSGTRDYVSVTIAEDDRGWRKNQIEFNFDFWTKELDFEDYNDYDERDAIIKAFKSIYGRISIKYDGPWGAEKDFYLEMIDNDEYDQEEIWKEYRELLSRKAA